YQLDRTEGVLLRYLADAYRTLRQTVATEHRTEEVEEITEWLGELVRGVDSSLLDEWERLANPVDDDADGETGDGPLSGTGAEAPTRPVTGNLRAFRVLVRNAMFRRVELASREAYSTLGSLDNGLGPAAGVAAPRDANPWDAEAWRSALDPMFEHYGDDAIGIGPAARSPRMLQITDRVDGNPRLWSVRQVLDDPDGDRDWAISALVDLDASDEAGHAVVQVTDVGPL
ncbi:MAG: DUF3516 domain-containing protein, partial [Cellulomonadaceae bacterium]